MQLDFFSPPPAGGGGIVVEAPSPAVVEVLPLPRPAWIYRASHCTEATRHRPDISDHDTEASMWAFIDAQLRSTGRRWTGYRVCPQTGTWTALPPVRLPSQGGREGGLGSHSTSPSRPTLLGRPWLVLDTETTGFKRAGADHAEIHQLAAVLLDADGEELASWEGRAKPRRLRGWQVEKALAVSGTKVEDLRSYPPPAAMLGRFYAWYDAQGRPIVTAYNRAFDEGMLLCEEIILDWGPCLQRKAQEALGQKKLKLEAAASMLGVALPEGGQTHQALDDARLAAAVMVALARRRQGRAAA